MLLALKLMFFLKTLILFYFFNYKPFQCYFFFMTRCGQWASLKAPLLGGVTEVCGLSKSHQWKWETNSMEDAVKMNQACFMTYKALAKAGWTSDAMDTKAAYNEVYNKAKRFPKHAVRQVKSMAEKVRFALNVSPKDGSIFKFAKQMEKCIRNEGETIAQ